MEVPLLRVPFEDWYCPNGCYCRETIPALPAGATRYHNCPRLHQLSAPLVRVGTDCSVDAIEREDYLNGEVQATGDDGKAYMAVTTRYADGRNDLAVNAGLARGRLGDWGPPPEIGPRLWAGRHAGSGSCASSRSRRAPPSRRSSCRQGWHPVPEPFSRNRKRLSYVSDRSPLGSSARSHL